MLFRWAATLGRAATGRQRPACQRQAFSSRRRPRVDDVYAISTGKRSGRRGVGSRGVPHRLDAAETRRFELAQRHGFLTVQGSGYRRGRKGAPLVNTHRLLCDARGVPTVRVEQQGSGRDEVRVQTNPGKSPPPVCLSVCLSVCPSVHPTNRPSICPSVRLARYTSISRRLVRGRILATQRRCGRS